MKQKDLKAELERIVGESNQHCYTSLVDIIKNHTEPSKKTLKKFDVIERRMEENHENLRDDINAKMSSDMFKWIVGTIITVGAVVISSQYKIMGDYFELYQQNLVDRIEYHSIEINEIKQELTMLREEFEFVSSEE